MQTLSVLGVEDGDIVAVSAEGERFRLPVDAALRRRLLAAAAAPEERRLSPREIQAHVRSGLSAEQVAAMTGVPVTAIERFTGPVLAERAYVVESALAVRLPPETEGARSRTFGAVMGERLDALAARDVHWSSAKEPAGWVLSVAFTADDLAHDARWRFDAKHLSLEPDNVEASTLSQQGVPAALTPRLRAIEPTAPVAVIAAAPARREPAAPDAGRFDSAAFRFPADQVEPRPTPDVARRRGRSGTAPAAVPQPAPTPQPADAGEVFAPRPASAPRAAQQRSTAPITPLRSRHADAVPVEDRPTEPLRRRRERAVEQTTAEVEPIRDERGSRPRRGRTSMPSWDEIVFGRDDTPS